jgi:mannobiose 2-epimerase
MGNQIKREFEKELDNILKYWTRYTVDGGNGGFYGRIDNHNTIDKLAVKGSVLNSRILWTFSAAYQYTQLPEHLAIAWRSFRYIEDFFIDKEFGGVYWSVDFTGKPLDTKKQVYAIAFAIYGITEFYKAVRRDEMLKLAKMLFGCIEEYSLDPINGGYLEAFSRDWTDLEDLRLSDKDANEKKTMNTHLHILEAYTNLYRVWPDEDLGKKIRDLLEVFDHYIIDKQTYHLNLFFDENWHSKSKIISFGHDIEASWLLLEAAEALGDKNLIDKFKLLGVEMATSTIGGLDKKGGLNYELEAGLWNKEKHWWVQAEAMVGFLNAFQISGKHIFYDRFEECWQFIKQYILDHQNGEWFWGLNEDFSVMPGQDKVGFWKCPYHNARASLEIIKRLNC